MAAFTKYETFPLIGATAVLGSMQGAMLPRIHATQTAGASTTTQVERESADDGLNATTAPPAVTISNLDADASLFIVLSDSSTDLTPTMTPITMSQMTSPEIPVIETREADVSAMFARARFEHLERGFESDFSRALTSAILTQGQAVITAIGREIFEPLTAPSVAAAAIITLAEIEDVHTQDLRRRLCERALTHMCAEIRDAATIALTDFADKRSILSLEAALKWEADRHVARELIWVLNYLRGLD